MKTLFTLAFSGAGLFVALFSRKGYVVDQGPG